MAAALSSPLFTSMLGTLRDLLATDPTSVSNIDKLIDIILLQLQLLAAATSMLLPSTTPGVGSDWALP